MNIYNLNELELGIAELPDGRLTNAFKEQERWQPALPIPFYCPHCHLPVYLDRRKRHFFFAHPVDKKYLDCPEVNAAISYLTRQSQQAEQFSELHPIKPITEWYCVWCRRFYTSQQRPVRKCCPKCREGIYSIPASQVTEDHSYFHYALNNQGIESLVRTPLLWLTDLTEPNVIDEAQ
ncbi:zinc-ribbon domain-containing protein [Providencia stuartii]|uniref:putative zinc ribbon protein n=1 Tax=Providencia stuartii TaxID=588 RepID=UPI004067F11E